MGILKPPGWRKVETQGCAVALLSFFLGKGDATGLLFLDLMELLHT